MNVRHRWHFLALAALLVATALIVVLAATKLHEPKQPASPMTIKGTSPIAAFLSEAPSRKLASSDVRPANAGSFSAEVATSSRSLVMPPGGMPLKQLVPSLLDEAAAGNKRAAGRLLKDLVECTVYVINRLQAKGQLAATKKLANVPSSQIEDTEKLLGELGDRLAADEVLCAGVDEEYFRGNAFDV